MRVPPVIVFILLFVSNATGQVRSEVMEGKVSYVTSENVYVKFASTGTLAPGDTIFVYRGDNLVPALTVVNLSSISAACKPMAGHAFAVGDQVVSKQRASAGLPGVRRDTAATAKPVPAASDTAALTKAVSSKRVQNLYGYASVASYLNFCNEAATTQRMKYTVNFGIDNLAGSKLSAEAYVTFSHKSGAWSEIQEDIFNGLKIYNLSLGYAINQQNAVWFGRRINPRISNVGAIDGLQYEYRPGRFTIGAFAGWRPDYQDYSFNPDLFQFGAYAGHDLAGKNGSMQTTLAFINQLNSGNTDRRFAYIQHANSLVRNLYFFGSAEVDLYRMTMRVSDTVPNQDTSWSADNSPSLSNLYLSLRYRPVRQVSLSVSYSSRETVIYYESYKNYVNRLLEQATVQGFGVQVSYQPVRMLTLGINAGYRDGKNDPKPAKNLYVYITYSSIPGIGASATLSGTLLETSYQKGSIYSVGLSRDFVRGKLSTGLDYRYVSYAFPGNESGLSQHMGEMNMTWRIMKKLSLGIYYEGTFGKPYIFNRVYANLTQRF